MKNLLIIFAITIIFSAHSQNINFPDPVLKSRLLSASPVEPIAGIFNGDNYTSVSIDINNDGEIQISEAQLINSLNVSNFIGQSPLITDISGLEYFNNLQMLDLSRVDLHNFSLAPYPNLILFMANTSNLDSIEISSAYSLEWLLVPNNNLTVLDFTANSHLKSLDCVNNLLTSLDFHANPDFFDLGCQSNNINYINVENGHFQNPGQGAWHGDDWSGNPLQTVCADSFEIESINSVLQFWQSTATVSSCILSVNDNSLSNFKIYPNPATDYFEIISNLQIKSIKIYDITGRNIYQWSGEDKKSQIDVSYLVSGIYNIQINSLEKTDVIKLIKK